MKKDLRAIDHDGTILNMDARQIDSTINDALADPETELVLVIAVNRDGNLVMPVLGPPSLRTLNMLEQATAAYKTALTQIKREKES